MGKVTIPAQARRPIARMVIKEVLHKHCISVDDFFSCNRAYEETMLKALVEICSRLHHDFNYPMSLVAQCVNRDRTTVLYHIWKHKAEEQLACQQ